MNTRADEVLMKEDKDSSVISGFLSGNKGRAGIMWTKDSTTVQVHFMMIRGMGPTPKMLMGAEKNLIKEANMVMSNVKKALGASYEGHYVDDSATVRGLSREDNRGGSFGFDFGPVVLTTASWLSVKKTDEAEDMIRMLRDEVRKAKFLFQDAYSSTYDIR